MKHEPKPPRKRGEDLISLFVSDWRPAPRHVRWAVLIAIILSPHSWAQRSQTAGAPLL